MTATQTVPVCDRCRGITAGRGFTATHKDGRELQLCPVHEREHRGALKAQGWEVTPNMPTPEPASRTGEKDQAYCHCGKLVGSRLVQPNPQSKMVRVTICPECDTRTCNAETPDGKCDKRPSDTKILTCPSGHDLLGRTA